ncbi:hypothetical protein L1987_71304 [Smallanthus sonchifolius]|uniref:Uncharacterized protein n=1 Tax=Smallanthus sonchifolius TaxID=185202 RepID=A0ACB9AR86_9ASTR|nr:hypothetical protein L1987_71304 [Smallanthus sonchifolius]
MSSFIYLLLEETRADLFSHLAQISQASASLISGLQRIALDSHKQLFYHLTLNGMKYDPAVGDLIALTQVKPKCIDDLAQSNTFFFPAYVTKVIHETPIRVQILSSQLIESNPYEIKGFVVYLTNLTTNLCIWQSFDLADNENIIQRTLSFSSSVEPGDKCCADEENGVIDLKLRQSFDSFNTSQEAAVLSCLATKKCYHENSFIKLIWGPPGTGKTKTVASLLFVLLRTKHRTLTCAPTNIAVVGVAKRLLSLLRDHDLGCDTYGFGDIVLFGNKERMKITVDHKELLDVFLDNRINVLRNCLSLWKTLTGDMIRFLENPVKEHQCFIVPMTTKTKSKKEKEQKRDENDEQKPLTFEEFLKESIRFQGFEMQCSLGMKGSCHRWFKARFDRRLSSEGVCLKGWCYSDTKNTFLMFNTGCILQLARFLTQSFTTGRSWMVLVLLIKLEISFFFKRICTDRTRSSMLIMQRRNMTRTIAQEHMLEVAVIAQIVANIFKESTSKKQKVTVGCISPYKAQVDAIQAKLGTKYNQQGNGWSFYVNIRSVDGFQGSEEDMIIFSIVICNHRRSIGFLSSRERANVALTRARNCLLIVGNKETMIKSGSIWNALVYDAENHGCVFDAHEDKNLAQVMVNFTNTFLERISGVRNLNVRKLVVSLLVKLSSGWRQVKTSKRNSYNDKRGMLNMFEIYNVNGDLCLLWSVDIVYENSLCVEILKFWDILRLSQIQQRAKRLESAFGNYTLEMISRCQTKLLESDLVLPMTWVVDSARDSTLVLTSHLAKLSLKDQTRKK